MVPKDMQDYANSWVFLMMKHFYFFFYIIRKFGSTWLIWCGSVLVLELAVVGSAMRGATTSSLYSLVGL